MMFRDSGASGAGGVWLHTRRLGRMDYYFIGTETRRCHAGRQESLVAGSIHSIFLEGVLP
jgi:hypothetical protein